MIVNDKLTYYKRKLILQLFFCCLFLIMPAIGYRMSEDFFIIRILSYIFFGVIIFYSILYVSFYLIAVPRGIILEENHVEIIKLFNKIEVVISDISKITHGVEGDIVIYYGKKKYHFIGFSAKIQDQIITKYEISDYIKK